MAATHAVVAAFLFALAAALQQKGALDLPEISLSSPASLLRLLGQTTWLVGTLALLAGYLFRAGALDRGRLAIIQPLLVTTVVFALPLGYFLTSQHVGRRQVVGAAVILLGLALFGSSATPPVAARTQPATSGRSRSRSSLSLASACSASGDAEA
jgi:drug/metabolite transporter (DMT)-like permease